MFRFLFRQFLAIDANFRLKRKNVSNDVNDPGLSNGWSYFVPETEFKDFIGSFGGLIIQSACFSPLLLIEHHLTARY